jgi:hypothetical protein
MRHLDAAFSADPPFPEGKAIDLDQQTAIGTAIGSAKLTTSSRRAEYLLLRRRNGRGKACPDSHFDYCCHPVADRACPTTCSRQMGQYRCPEINLY